MKEGKEVGKEGGLMSKYVSLAKVGGIISEHLHTL